MSWAAAMAALCVVGFAGFHFVAPRFNTPSDALAMNEIEQAPQQSAAPEAAAASEPAAAALETNEAPPPARRGIVVRTYDEAVSALDAPGSRVALELCNGARCGLTRVRVGDVITVRVRSPTAGRLWLMDRNSEGDRQQIFPNGLSRAGAALRVEANETISLPTVDHQFAFQVSEPIGPSLLTAVVMNDSVEAPPVMQRNAQNTRGIGVVSRTELDGVAAPVTQSLAVDGDAQAVSIGELQYIVTR